MVEMTDAELDEVAAQMILCKYQKGDAIVVKGDIADGLYQLISGAADVEMVAPDCGQLAVSAVRHLSPGDFFGEKALVSSKVDATRNATVRATERNTQCLRLDVTNFQQLWSFQSILQARQALMSPEQHERHQRHAEQRRAHQATMATMLFAELDASRDGYLHLEEMQLLARRTGGTLSAGQYAQICELVDTDVDTGERNTTWFLRFASLTFISSLCRHYCQKSHENLHRFQARESGRRLQIDGFGDSTDASL